MKKSIIIMSTALVSLVFMAFIFTDRQPPAKGIEWRDVFLPTCTSAANIIPDFHYEVDTRFRANITKSDLDRATSVADLVPEDAGWDTHPIKNTEVALMVEHGETVIKAKGAQLNENQLQLLRKANYSDDLRVLANCEKQHGRTGEIEPYHLIYYITIQPEKEAEYINGHDAFVAYLKDNSREAITGLKEDMIRPGKVRFTVNAQGGISDVKLTSTSGFQTVDERMIKLIEDAPGQWEPARDANGNRIDQVLVFSFGKVGC